MPFIPNRIEAVCGASLHFMPHEDNAATVKTKLNEKGTECAGCTFTIDQHTGRITLISTDPFRECLENKAPIAQKK